MTENTGWPPQPDPAQPTQEQLAEAARQIASQNVGVTSAADPAALGMQALAAGAEPAEVDASELLASIRALQGRITALEAEKRAATAPAVVRYAQAILDHLST